MTSDFLPIIRANIRLAQPGSYPPRALGLVATEFWKIGSTRYEREPDQHVFHFILGSWRDIDLFIRTAEVGRDVLALDRVTVKIAGIAESFRA